MGFTGKMLHDISIIHKQSVQRGHPDEAIFIYGGMPEAGSIQSIADTQPPEKNMLRLYWRVIAPHIPSTADQPVCSSVSEAMAKKDGVIEIEGVVSEAAADLPREFRAALDEIPVVIDPMPSARLVGAPESGHPPDILGLFTGVPLGEHGPLHAPETRAIYLFQRNLERAARTRAELRQEIKTTLYHELGHALGFDEEGVDELGLA